MSFVLNRATIFPAIGDETQLNVPDLLDFNLENNPDFPLYVYPSADSSGIVEVRMLEFVRATHRVGNIVRKNSQPGEVVAIVANIDALLYAALVVGIMKAGLVPFPISPRNSSPALVHLIRATSTHRILVTQNTLRSVLDGLKAELDSVDPTYELEIEEAPTLQDAFPFLGREVAEDPFTPISPAFSPQDSDKGIYLHSSGSTGFPKPILFTHKIIKDDASLLYIPRMREYFHHSINGALGLPSFHMMGFCFQMLMPLYGLITTGLFTPTVTHPDAVPILGTAETVLEAAKIIKPSCMMSPPTFLASWAHSDHAIEFFRTMRNLSYGGGPIAASVAESLIASGINVSTGYGGTEFGVVTELRLDQSDTWQYFEFKKEVNIRWVPQGDGTFEAQFLTSKAHHLAVENLPDVPGYATSDLFEPHPTIPNLWKIVGRIDDVIIHSSGEKTVPGPIEAIISADPLVCGALVFGRQRDQPGILLEPSPEYSIDVKNEAEVSKFRNAIWPAVEEANRISPAFSKIYKEMILVVDPEKPLPRVGKGTIAKKAALALYEAEIHEIYAAVEMNSGGNSIEPPISWNSLDLETWIVEQISDILSIEPPSVTADLFEIGMDSLSSTMLRLRLVSALRKSDFAAFASAITQNIIYNYPTISQLQEAILSIISNPDGHPEKNKTHEDLIEEMISKYSIGLDEPLQQPALPFDPEKQIVLLTGSTGNLGAQLLASLLAKNTVARVYTLNRPSNKASMYDRHRARFEDKALDVSLLSSPKLVFLAGETSHDDLGLPQDVLNELRQNLTLIIHNAWRLDFNLSLASFESHVKGSRVLIDLARSSRYSSSIRFLFTSSIGSTQAWDARLLGPYPEEVVMDPKYAVGGGYGESKYVTERILATSGLKATSFRIGQVTGGAPNGAWATSDWVPIIVKSSLTIGVLPAAYGVVSWVPMDAVCDAILDIGFNVKLTPMAVNVVHPKPVPWTAVMENIRLALIEEKNLARDALPLVPYQDWIGAVEKQASASDKAGEPTDALAVNMPAVKLLEFYKQQAVVDDALRTRNDESTGTMESVGLTQLVTRNVQRLSEKMRALDPLNSELIRKWVKYWIAAGF
ncbi:acetyl-CoA synthetase-like protein [Lentinula raphanica]|uniref:Acetyl-CoA synthetase-like protein n=1 Tax=Lentinula raphanica TaxID=153919 RepID=A0AA38P695_9AGAR|nr:acetyl-CoA synthetase-like protein [Lentinula raphanica]KAJ3837112.1 acetyl-CoA synthetase-like protein [Lentinula raphanica]